MRELERAAESERHATARLIALLMEVDSRKLYAGQGCSSLFTYCAVNEAGIVTDARVLRSIPPLDDAALKAVREWRYDLTMVDGVAIPVKMTVTVNFTRSK